MMSFTEVAPTEVERPLTEKKGHRWLPYLTLVLLAEMWVTVHLLRHDPGFVNWLGDWQARRAAARRTEQLQALMRYDPRVGQIPPMRLPGLDGRTPILAVFIGACSSCVVKTLLQWESVETENQRLKIVIVVRNSPQRVKAFWKENHLTLPFVADPEGDLHRAYNVIYLPRTYGMDAEGRLVWIQKKDALSVGEVARVAWASMEGETP